MDLISGNLKISSRLPALAYSSPEAVQTTGTVADVGLDARLELVKDRPDLGVHHASPTINFETINSQAQR
jgi:hypothetical protein